VLIGTFKECRRNRRNRLLSRGFAPPFLSVRLYSRMEVNA
jgi:hypothetical protein